MFILLISRYTVKKHILSIYIYIILILCIDIHACTHIGLRIIRKFLLDFRILVKMRWLETGNSTWTSGSVLHEAVRVPLGFDGLYITNQFNWTGRSKDSGQIIALDATKIGILINLSNILMFFFVKLLNISRKFTSHLSNFSPNFLLFIWNPGNQLQTCRFPVQHR